MAGILLCIDRLYRLDNAYPEFKIGIEVDGGTLSKERSGHSTGTGLARDREKSTLLATLGWLLIRVTPKELMTLKTIELIKVILNKEHHDFRRVSKKNRRLARWH
jgi:very-short-patch-repair endonuclease